MEKVNEKRTSTQNFIGGALILSLGGLLAKILGALCVSEYGVHIVYYTDDVKAQTLDFSTLAKCLDTTSREYLRFKTQYTTDSKELVSKALTELKKSYFTVKDKDGKVANESKIKFAPMFDTFLKDQGLSYDKSKATTYSED